MNDKQRTNLANNQLFKTKVSDWYKDLGDNYRKYAKEYLLEGQKHSHYYNPKYKKKERYEKFKRAEMEKFAEIMNDHIVGEVKARYGIEKSDVKLVVNTNLDGFKVQGLEGVNALAQEDLEKYANQMGKEFTDLVFSDKEMIDEDKPKFKRNAEGIAEETTDNPQKHDRVLRNALYYFLLLVAMAAVIAVVALAVAYLGPVIAPLLGAALPTVQAATLTGVTMIGITYIKESIMGTETKLKKDIAKDDFLAHYDKTKNTNYFFKGVIKLTDKIMTSSGGRVLNVNDYLARKQKNHTDVLKAIVKLRTIVAKYQSKPQALTAEDIEYLSKLQEQVTMIQSEAKLGYNKYLSDVVTKLGNGVIAPMLMLKGNVGAHVNYDAVNGTLNKAEDMLALNKKNLKADEIVGLNEKELNAEDILALIGDNKFQKLQDDLKKQLGPQKPVSAADVKQGAVALDATNAPDLPKEKEERLQHIAAVSDVVNKSQDAKKTVTEFLDKASPQLKAKMVEWYTAYQAGEEVTQLSAEFNQMMKDASLEKYRTQFQLAMKTQQQEKALVSAAAALGFPPPLQQTVS